MNRFAENDIILKNYRIEKSIGQGAFGEVYLATHLGLNGKRAVKVLLRDEVGIGSTEYDEYRNRFRQESQLMEWFNHPNIIRVYDFQEEDNTLFLVMEYAAGGSLREWLDEKKKSGVFFTAEETVKTGIEIAEGLALLHSRDIVHRDLKPSNILFDAAGHAKVADLGLAQVPGGASMRSQLSIVKPHPGTPAYKSPEQEVAGSYLRPASDIYSLGLILFEMLTGRGYKSLRPGTRLKSLSPDSPAWLDDLLLRMLSDNPKDRPWDGMESAELLKNGKSNQITGIQRKETNEKSEIPDVSYSQKIENETERAQRKEEINRLEEQCGIAIENRDWEKAQKVIKTLEGKGGGGMFAAQRCQIAIDNSHRDFEQSVPEFFAYFKNNWSEISPILIIIVFFVIIIFFVYSVKNITSSNSVSQIPTVEIWPTATKTPEIDYKKEILGKWVVTEAIDDPTEQGPSWQQPGNTMEFFTDGNQEMIWDGMRSGTPYRVEGNIVYFTFQDGRSDGWKITFFNSGNTITLSAMKTTEKMTLNRE
jgi:serine/threonine protein kinase